ncbi:hypothetical protein AVEN_102124-2-1, partial [Araneus ventricosus]
LSTGEVRNAPEQILKAEWWIVSSRLKTVGRTKPYSIPLTPSGPQNLITFVYRGFVDIWIREMDSSAFSPFLLTVGGRKPTGA